MHELQSVGKWITQKILCFGEVCGCGSRNLINGFSFHVCYFLDFDLCDKSLFFKSYSLDLCWKDNICVKVCLQLNQKVLEYALLCFDEILSLD